MSRSCDIGNHRSSALLSQGDPPPFRVLNEVGGAEFLILCDHAGRGVPSRLGDLGLPPEAMDQHIAWDIGAAGVASELSKRLGAAAILQTYSRLVVDCNRKPGQVDSIPLSSDGWRVPANQDLPDEAVSARFREIFDPYHREIANLVRGLMARGRPIVVSVHSFTPELGGNARAWGYGVLHEGTSPFSNAMLALLEAEAGCIVGDNQPYAMDGTDFTVPHHAIANGLDYLELEIRQDMIADAEGQARAADLLARLLPLARRQIA